MVLFNNLEFIIFDFDNIVAMIIILNYKVRIIATKFAAMNHIIITTINYSLNNIIIDWIFNYYWLIFLFM